MNWPLNRRLHRLKSGSGYFHLLALDHGLTSGSEPSPDQFDHWVRFVEQSGLTGFVCNYGVATHLSQITTKGLILQCFGAPDLSGRGIPKVNIYSPEDALRVSADAVSVQANFVQKYPHDYIRDVGKFIVTSHHYALPVLLMIQLPKQFNARELVFSIRVAIEIGADVIKVPLPHSAFGQDVDEIRKIVASVNNIVFAGGPVKQTIASVANVAKEFGFAGFCVGRNIFLADEPNSVVTDLINIFS